MANRILVIDHHPQGLERVVGPLRGAGYEVAIARTAADGASSFGQFAPNLVFIAARLPRTHGTVLCRELKRTDAGTSTPIVLVVESTEIQIDLPPLDQFGADRLIQKPVGAEELLNLCRELLHPATAATPARDSGDPGGVDYADDGLSTALEELDALEFDLPEDIVRGAPGPPPAPTGVPISDEASEDINNRLDDLFGGTPAESVTETAAADAAPSTGHDHEADTGVLDELDIDNELNTRLGRATEDATPRRRLTDRPTPVPPTPNRRATDRPEPAPAPRPAAPPAPSVTAASQRSEPATGPVAGTFQTELLTRKASEPARSEPAKASNTPVPPKWIWIAIPVTVAVVVLGVVLMDRLKSAPVSVADTSTRTTAEPVGDGTLASPLALGTPTGTVDAFEQGPHDGLVGGESDPLTFVGTEDIQPEPAGDPTVLEAAPAEPDTQPAPVRRPRKTPPPEVEPEPKRAIAEPETVTRPPAPEVQPEQKVAEPEPVEPEPDSTAPEPQATVADAPPVPEPLVEDEPRSTPEPVFEEPEAVVEETATVLTDETPEPPAPAPVTREPILVQRVEPRVSPKDLKKGGGTVLLKVRVGTNGAVNRVVVQQGLPGSPLEGAAVAAVLRWRYEPALDAGSPIEAWAIARFEFTK